MMYRLTWYMMYRLTVYDVPSDFTYAFQNIYDVPSDVELNTATTVACAVALLALFITIAYHLSEE